ncbi:MAG: aminotransferase class I/II-fold pyridoxal phosphate-dependent enzyme [Allosphingosinicella sp.]
MFDPGVVSFAHGEGLRRPYPEALHNARRSLFDEVNSPVENYLYRQSFAALDVQIAAEFERLGVPGECANNVVIDAGSTRLIYVALSVFLSKGDLVLTGPGFYHPLAAWCDALGLELVVVSANNDDGLRLSRDELDLKLRARRFGQRALLLLFNPTLIGAAYSQAHIEQIAEVVSAHGALAIEDVLLDTGDGEAASPAGRLARSVAHDQTFTVAGASKQHCLANLRIGWGCGPDALVRLVLERVCDLAASIPHVAKAAALGALAAPPIYRRANVAEAFRRLRLFDSLIADLDSEIRNITGHSEPIIRVAYSPQCGHSVLLDFSGFARICGLSGPEVGAMLTRFFLVNAATAFAPVSSQGIAGPLLRANLVSVGTAFTYPISREIEEDWPVVWDRSCEERFAFPFAQAWALIAQTLVERVRPAILGAIRHRTIDGCAQPQLLSRSVQ